MTSNEADDESSNVSGDSLPLMVSRQATLKFISPEHVMPDLISDQNGLPLREWFYYVISYNTMTNLVTLYF